MLRHLFSIAFLFLVTLTTSFGQSSPRMIPASETQSSIAVIHGPHWVFAPAPNSRKNKLVISIPGTGGSPNGLASFDSVASLLGFHAISLDYKNDVITTVCRASLDSNCYDLFRKEIVFGTPVSDTVHVDSVNSIHNRIYRLLAFLSSNYPKDGWENFFRNGIIIWPNIIASGHSQGAGHAAYLGKNFPLDKVIILAGPQDYLDHFERPAPWINMKTKTPPERYFALLHRLDPFGFEKQFASCLRLSQTQSKDSISLDAPHAMAKKGNILITHVNLSPHGSVANPIQARAWKYMLEK